MDRSATSPKKENASDTPLQRASSRASWQQRPKSQASERPRSRPLSMVAAENLARSPRATPELKPPIELNLTRDQIAQNLASKDPAWFRQTADRGLNSPAYRRSQVEDEERADHGSSAQMPGMSGSGEPTKERSLSRSAEVLASASSVIGSPSPTTEEQRFEPPKIDLTSESRSPAMSPSQGRISPERLDRPASPTKGMGGFVQSAMMKRSDSVSKRWSVQSPPGLNRANSVVSNRSSYDPVSAKNPPGSHSRPGSVSRDHSPMATSRPGSSHSNATITQDGRPGTSGSMRSNITSSTSNDGFIKPGLPASRTAQDIKPGPPASIGDRPETTPPSSPSRTMDTRRWSPTKSSWLESALNKPDSPKPKFAPPPQQPAWMSEIHKAKQKGSVDLGKSPTLSGAPKHEVSIGGLMRSPPPGGMRKTINVGGLNTGLLNGETVKARSDSISSSNSIISPSKEESPHAPNPLQDSTPKSSPVVPKPKPAAPPKNDFRSSLKSRPVSKPAGPEEPEFKNVFGQLRSTKTQNYVAPDELKSNITRGKAALNNTGGPQKTERKDEFKDAILKKKEDFKSAQLEGKGVTRESTTAQNASIPEALARRQTLVRSNSIAARLTPSAAASPVQQSHKATLPVDETSTPDRIPQGKEAIGGKLAGRFNPALAGLLARGPPPVGSDSSRSSSPSLSQRNVSMSTSTSADTSEPGPQLTHMTKGRARGPRRKAPSSVPVNAAVSEAEHATVSKATSTSSAMKNDSITMPKPLEFTNEDKPEPTADSDSPVSQPSSPSKLNMKRRSQFLQNAPTKYSKMDLQSQSPKPISPIKSVNSINISTPSKSKFTEPEVPLSKQKPITPTKSPTLSKKFDTPTPATAIQVDSPETAKLRPSPLSPRKPIPNNTTPQSTPVKSPVKAFTAEIESPETAKLRPSPLSPQKTATNAWPESIKSQTDVLERRSSQPASIKSPVSVKNTAALWDQPSVTQPLKESTRARSPIKLPTYDDEKAAMVGAGLRSPSPVKASQTDQLPKSTRPLPTPPVKVPLSLTPGVGLGISTSPTRSLNSSVPQASEASKMVSDFFGPHGTPPNFVADTAEILSARPEPGPPIKTSRVTLYQFSGDGKKQLVPTHQERLLFESNMYLCVHAFGSASGKMVTEVYFWTGDGVPVAMVDGAKGFAQKEAKAVGGILVNIQQGKETPEFFQALGGILVIRRGSANKYDSLAPHILCGRKHFGQIAFDEVDYSPASLCSGFPYLISTPSGKAYLWKGKGSGIDELSCARLLGMDVGLMGEIEEVEDGSEPASFLNIFGNGADIPKSADHWRMKPNYTKYCGRLFCANSSVKSQITEISPFCQSDVSPSNIYILDAFFEIYIVVGSKAQSEYPAFHNSLMFAQEYGILAAGMEDRPYVPVTTVVLEGIPKDMKSVFRKWSDDLTPTMVTPTSPGLQRGRSLRVVPLTAVLEATRR